MATKKPTITLGKGTPAIPATRPVSAKPSQASQVRAAQRTTSSGITTRPDGRRQSEGRSGRQATSRATVSNSGQGVTPGSAGGRVTTGRGGIKPPMNPSNALKVASMALGGLRGVGLQAIGEAVAPRPTSTRANLKEGQAAANAAIKAKGKTADSFGGQYQKPAAGAKPKPAPKMPKAKSFDNAFASARNSGMSSFVWDGKRYSTKLK